MFLTVTGQGEAPIDTKLNTQEDQVKWNTFAKNHAPGMFLQEGTCGGNIHPINRLLMLASLDVSFNKKAPPCNGTC